jgi:hypothetical protein
MNFGLLGVLLPFPCYLDDGLKFLFKVFMIQDQPPPNDAPGVRFIAKYQLLTMAIFLNQVFVMCIRFTSETFSYAFCLAFLNCDDDRYQNRSFLFAACNDLCKRTRQWCFIPG